ncbi:uncharacterized protein isoform X2 [Leptinotarsa decemlineata]|uniref:uncharacterized protein isoform X2 n=1 Tax=Leptinotarsa decemlineata TaxID=7539 RepID=UPI000C253BE7|nr:zinc finger protein 474-like isoform X2 [Leptinotarsa decemlineata]
MKLRTPRKTYQTKPFLILPLLDSDLVDRIPKEMPTKNPGLNLFIKTWPPKSKHKDNDCEENKRPLTATLEKPTILDIRLMGKIDMSKIRKEFLNISNLCRMPIILKGPKVTKPHRPLSLPPAKKTKKKQSDPDDSWEDEESSRSSKLPKKRIARLKPGEVKKVAKCCDTNNNKTSKVPRRTAVKVLGVANDAQSTKLPEPCKSCRRSDLPERFHSHPANPPKTVAKMGDASKSQVKSTVQKPIAIKYKSKPKSGIKPSALPKRETPTQKVVNSTLPSGNLKTSESKNSESKISALKSIDSKIAVPKVQQEPKTAELKPSESRLAAVKHVETRIPEGKTVFQRIQEPSTRVGSAKRTLTCYLCGREFGSASLPLHEPKCLEKWERENASLPTHLRRKPPPKPDATINREEWNKLAWDSAQSTLLSCSNCGRTFYPDRLVVHQRSCKIPQVNVKVSSSELQLPNGTAMSRSTPSTPSNVRPPPIFECYICGKEFGVNSIKIHEKQCLKKWNIENDSLPPDMRSPPPLRKEKHVSEPPRVHQKSESEIEREDRPSSSRKPPLFPCYICGKLFTVNSIYIHEPQCLKMWKIENEKLPPSKRRPQPLKPDIKFTRDGKIDFEATNEANWQCHLSQLVPCKNCSRTFNPDRVDIHERSCKGC